MLESFENGQLFAADGYLALALPQIQDTGSARALDRHWLAASTTAEIRLSNELSALILTIRVKGTPYVRTTIADVASSGQIQASSSSSQPRMLSPQHTCSCWCLASTDKNVRACYSWH